MLHCICTRQAKHSKNFQHKSLFGCDIWVVHELHRVTLVIVSRSLPRVPSKMYKPTVAIHCKGSSRPSGNKAVPGIV